MFKRIFLVVLDGFGVGELEDASKYEDEGTNTLKHIVEGTNYNLNVMEKLGFLNLVGKNDETKYSIYSRLKSKNLGKDSLNGHYEMMGIVLDEPFKTYPNGDVKIFDEIDIGDFVSKLHDKDLKILSINSSDEGVEEYYLNLVKGGNK